MVTLNGLPAFAAVNACGLAWNLIIEKVERERTKHDATNQRG